MSKSTPSQALIDAQKRTLARLSAIQQQFASNKGSGRFAGKVAIVTGAGSEKGIGYDASERCNECRTAYALLSQSRVDGIAR